MDVTIKYKYNLLIEARNPDRCYKLDNFYYIKNPLYIKYTKNNKRMNENIEENLLFKAKLDQFKPKIPVLPITV